MEISKSMQFALAFAVNNGGFLVRYQGGYWAQKDWKPHTWPWFKTVTIEALVSRGLMSYAEWKEGRNGRFPIVAVVCEPPNQVLQQTADHAEVENQSNQPIML